VVDDVLYALHMIYMLYQTAFKFFTMTEFFDLGAAGAAAHASVAFRSSSTVAVEGLSHSGIPEAKTIWVANRPALNK
jgi:hypothetical protein